MGFFNIGQKDEYGKQRRIEHRGKHLRASRTGGVALRAQAQALGARLTANTQRGFRVSTTPMKNTQIALQNGRFVLRGRYGSGPFRLNLSKTGVSVSTRNRLGSFNWLKPNRSSAKILGVQLRGKNAAALQVAYMIVAAAVTATGLLLRLLYGLILLLVAVLDLVYRLGLATPYAWRTLLRRMRNKRLFKRISRLEAVLGEQMDNWGKEQLIAAALLIFVAWGRGREAKEAAPALGKMVAEHGSDGPLQRSIEALSDVDQSLENCREALPSESDLPLAAFAMISRRLLHSVSENELVEVLLQIDEIALQEGERTVLQERMLEVFADFAGLQFFEEEKVESAAEATELHADSTGSAESITAEDGQSGDGRIDLNTASLEELQTLPQA